MASNGDRNIRRLMKRYRIAFKTLVASDQWPSAHSNTFENIRKIGDKKLETYCAAIDIRLDDEPWRERTKYRAEWLAKRASHLFSQQRNEAGWRFGLENDILLRLSVEVACPRCRARIWRSEIEASIHESDDVTSRLEEQRRQRQSCSCPPKDRPQDYYEVGTNPLFDDRVQEVIIHDPELRTELPNKEPDRVYGLQATDNFERLLSTTIASGLPDDSDITLRDIVRTCPFKEGIEPLLFPFLILEAKSEKSVSGFDDIQAQTAFPILSLLKLQQDLHAQVLGGGLSSPLLWFFANRGDIWRVYGCCVSEETPRGYDIFQLWDGSIMSGDNALQLLLIVDYVFDWARDIYRPSILRHLKALATGDAYDQISLTADSDIASVYMRREISEWIQPPSSIVTIPDSSQDFTQPAVALDHQSLLHMPIPNTKLGTLRPSSLIQSRVAGLYITKQNVTPLLQLAGGEEPARRIVNFLTRWDEVLLLTKEDLDYLEETWTGEVRNTASIIARTSEFYVLIEPRSFIDLTWNIVREMNYLAVSKRAFEILVKYSDFKIKHPGILSISQGQTARPCSKGIFGQAVRCLSSGSPSQLFLAAISCTCLSVYSLPERKRADYTPPTEVLGFGLVDHPRLPDFIQRFHRLGQQNETNLTRPLCVQDAARVAAMV